MLALADVDDGVETDLLGEGEAAVDGVDRAARDARGDDVLEPLLGGPRAQPLGQERAQLVAVRGAVLVAGEAGVVGQLRDAEHLHQLAELAVVAGRHDQVAVGARQRLVGEEARVAVAHPVRHDATGDEGAALVDHARQRRGEQVDLDVLAAPGVPALVEGGQDADGRVHAGHHVEDRDAGAVGVAVGRAGEAHQPRDGLHDEVVARELGALLGAAEPADRGVDHARVGRRTVSKSRPKRVRPPGRKFSITTSARRASSRAAALSVSSFRSSATERLLRLTPRKYVATPSRTGATRCGCRRRRDPRP